MSQLTAGSLIAVESSDTPGELEKMVVDQVSARTCVCLLSACALISHLQQCPVAVAVTGACQVDGERNG